MLSFRHHQFLYRFFYASLFSEGAQGLQRGLGDPVRGDCVPAEDRLRIVRDSVQGTLAWPGGCEEAERVRTNAGPDAGVQERGCRAAQDPALQRVAVHGPRVPAAPGHRHPVVRRYVTVPAPARQRNTIPRGPSDPDRQADGPGDGVSFGITLSS